MKYEQYVRVKVRRQIESANDEEPASFADGDMVSRLQGVEPRLLFTRISLGTEGDTESTIDGQDTG